LQREAGQFPRLFVELIAVGERTGRLTETFEALEHHFQTTVESRRLLRQALTWPVLSYVAAVLVIAALLLVLGMIAPNEASAFDPLGLGLLGPRGAILWLSGWCCITLAVVLTFRFLRDHEATRARWEALALRVPGVGSCFRAWALQRFSMALAMTGEAGLSVPESLRLSYRVACNEALGQHGEAAVKAAKKGRSLSEILGKHTGGLLPGEFLDAIHVGETSGRLPEVLSRLATEYQAQATRQAKQLAMLLGGFVYAMVGLMIVILILRIAMSIGGVYQDAMKGL
jgi:type IV pilus assembly protein PilC